MTYNLRGKTILVTGASRGLGAAIAEKLAENGAKVAINFLSRFKDAQKVEVAIKSKGNCAELFQADITDESQAKQLYADVLKTLGPIEVLVINATLVHVHKEIEELTWQDMLSHLNYFLKSPLLLVQQALPYMKKQRSGRIIQIGSEAFERGLPRLSQYVAAKGAQLGITRSWANELGPWGITVNLIAPGWIPTEMHQSESEEIKQDYIRTVPLGHMGQPDDVANMAVFLASEESRFITGQRFTVNGGKTMP